MSKQINLGVSYVVSAIDTKTNKRVFQGTDSYSGGYPYWATYIEAADKLKTAGEAQKRYSNQSGFLASGVQDVEILKVSVIAEVMTRETIISEERAKAQAEINKIQADLAEHIRKLEAM